MTVSEKKLAYILENISILLQIKGDNPFKARAYAEAARKISSREVDILAAYQNNSVQSLPGFGDALVKKINEFFETGKISFYEKLINEIPESVAELNKVKNIGISKARTLYYDLKIKNLEDLVEACLNNKLLAIKGINERIQEQIFNSAQHRIASRGRFRQEEGFSLANKIMEDIQSIESVLSVQLTSDYRRFTETINEFVFFIQIGNKQDKDTIVEKMEEIFSKYKQFNNDNIILKYIIATEENAGWLLHSSTGNSKYLERFYSYVKSCGFVLQEDGLYRDNQKINIRTEVDLYNLLNLQFIPPELRESPVAIEKAMNYQIPNLLEFDDIKGLVHVHSNWSDGKNSIEEMAHKAKELGFSYIVICDHSFSASYTGGLSIDRVKEQHKEIDRLNNIIDGIKILKGIESDILVDGSLDYPDDILKNFDLVVASIHSNFNMNKQDMTNRIIKAIQNKYTDILGHPTGRLILSRLPYEVDIIEIVKACADFGKVIEINANPYRLDLNWENVVIAKEYGNLFSINPDSHNINTFTDVRYGVKVARKGWLEAKDVINTKDSEEFLEFFKNY